MGPPTFRPRRRWLGKASACRTLWTLAEHLFDSRRHAVRTGVRLLNERGGVAGALAVAGTHALVLPHGSPYIAGVEVAGERLLDREPPQFAEVLVVRPRPRVGAAEVGVHPLPEVDESHASIMVHPLMSGTCGTTKEPSGDNSACSTNNATAQFVARWVNARKDY